MLALLSGCNERQSMFATFGLTAERVAALTIFMVVAGALIFIAVMALSRHAIRAPENAISHTQGMRMVLWLGGIVPAVSLLALLIASLPLMRPLPVTAADLVVAVEGEQFWWRVRYPGPNGGAPVETANQIRVPVGQTVELRLTGADVVHSFWVPGLAGKMDMIPGRENRLVVRATEAGVYRGQCTEFCGLSHALMAFDVVAMEPAAFNRWLAAEARPAVTQAAPGAALFEQNGCAACHAVRGTAAIARIGPDLTHFGARATAAAGILPMERQAVARFIRDAGDVKPGARMPTYAHMSAADSLQIADWLIGLRPTETRP